VALDYRAFLGYGIQHTRYAAAHIVSEDIIDKYHRKQYAHDRIHKRQSVQLRKIVQIFERVADRMCEGTQHPRHHRRYQARQNAQYYHILRRADMLDAPLVEPAQRPEQPVFPLFLDVHNARFSRRNIENFMDIEY
jgi:hypothetical protein